MHTCPDALILFSAWPAPDVFLSRSTTRSIEDRSVCMVKGGAKTSPTSWRTTHSQIRHSYGMGYDMAAHRGFVSVHVAAEHRTACNRNDEVSVAPALNDTFYQEPHLVSSKDYTSDPWVGRA